MAVWSPVEPPGGAGVGAPLPQKELWPCVSGERVWIQKLTWGEALETVLIKA